jgi:hypothetical protein
MTRPEIPDWSGKHDTILSLAGLVQQRLPLLTSAPGYESREVAAAYLARCRRLILGMDLLRREGFADLIGALLRILFENWLHGMWVLLGGVPILESLKEAHQGERERLNRMAQLELDDLVGAELGIRGISVEAISQQVGRMLVAAGDPGGAHLVWSYQPSPDRPRQQPERGRLL